MYNTSRIIWKVTVLHVSPTMFIFSHFSLSSLSGNSTFESVWAWQYCSILWHRNGTFFLFWFHILFYDHFDIFFVVYRSLVYVVLFFLLCSIWYFLLVYLFNLFRRLPLQILSTVIGFITSQKIFYNVPNISGMFVV